MPIRTAPPTAIPAPGVSPRAPGHAARTPVQMATNSRLMANYSYGGAGCSFTLLTCPASMGRSFHLSFRAVQRQGHPHLALSRSTQRNFLAGSFTHKSTANRVRTATAPGSVKHNLATNQLFGQSHKFKMKNVLYSHQP